MTQQTTRLTQQDLKIYPLERLTDADDGLMMDIDNGPFTPSSDVDHTMHTFNVRLVYPHFLCNNAETLDDTDVVITEPCNK